jgi:hypothetical protein
MAIFSEKMLILLSINLMIKGRTVLREMPWVFIRCNSHGDYEFFDESKKEVVEV